MRTDSSPRTDIADGGPALFRLVRFWSRRWAATAARDGTGDVAHVGLVLVLEAIDAASAKGSAAVGDVAVELGLDRSNASRMLAAAVSAGFVTKTTSPDDARRTELGTTAAGRSLLTAARAWQQEEFAQLVATWPAPDASRFAGYLKRLASQSTAPTSPRRPPMTIVLNHTIVPVGDKHRGAQFLADLLGIVPGPPAGPFVPVRLNDDLTLDFDDRLGARPGHYAFLVDDSTFDRALGLARDSEIEWGSAPRLSDRQINRTGGGRGVYVRDPDGIAYELFTALPLDE
jgi:DNA-binding MarR family transcriptional regulator/catechol 2,3-dioxygenase-like lactoylglutathione lyase family enzyme